MAKLVQCPYCSVRSQRVDLIKHIDKVHQDMIPEGYSSIRIVYDIVNNNKNSCGTCRVCKSPTKWNESSGKYDVLCDNPKCKLALREAYKKNMLRVRGTYNILNDPEQQKIMLSHRKISGIYNHSDGGKIQYTGEYERKFLEFIDTMLNIPSKDIISPGLTIQYTYKDKLHYYLPDFYYIPYNLIIEIKDGGDNPNNKKSIGMDSSREKTIEKERIITDKGEYNYLRLTNNQFVQLIDIFMAIKKAIMDGDSVSKIIKINESFINNDPIIMDKKVFIDGLPDEKNKRGFTNLFNILNKFKRIGFNDIEYSSIQKNSIICMRIVKFIYNALKVLGLSDNEIIPLWFQSNDEEKFSYSTILLYFGESTNSYYWLEYAYNDLEGIRVYHNQQDAIHDIANKILEVVNKIYNIDKLYATVYDPNSIFGDYNQIIDLMKQSSNLQCIYNINETSVTDEYDYQDDIIHISNLNNNNNDDNNKINIYTLQDDLAERINNDEGITDQDIIDSQK